MLKAITKTMETTIMEEEVVAIIMEEASISMDKKMGMGQSKEATSTKTITIERSVIIVVDRVIGRENVQIRIGEKRRKRKEEDQDRDEIHN